MFDVEIIGMGRIPFPKPNKGGSTILAYFTCATHGLRLHGCAFVRTAKGGLTVWPPRIHIPEFVHRSVDIIDDRFRQEMVRAAQVTYRALGGTDGECLPTVAPVADDCDARDVKDTAPEADDAGMKRFIAG